MFTRFIVPAIVAIVATSASPILAQPSEGQSSGDTAQPPIIIDSQTNEYDLRSGVTRFSDDVRIQRGDMLVHADKGAVHQADGRISVVELSGEPTTWRDRLEDGSLVEGEAQNIHFDVIENIVTLTGNARILHEQGEFTGDELVYDLDSESLVGRSQGEGRVRVVLEPGSMDRNQQSENDDAGDDAGDQPLSESQGEDPAGDAADHGEAGETDETVVTDPSQHAGEDTDDSTVPDPPARTGER